MSPRNVEATLDTADLTARAETARDFFAFLVPRAYVIVNMRLGRLWPVWLAMGLSLGSSGAN